MKSFKYAVYTILGILFSSLLFKLISDKYFYWISDCYIVPIIVVLIIILSSIFRLENKFDEEKLNANVKNSYLKSILQIGKKYPIFVIMVILLISYILCSHKNKNVVDPDIKEDIPSWLDDTLTKDSSGHRQKIDILPDINLETNQKSKQNKPAIENQKPRVSKEETFKTKSDQVNDLRGINRVHFHPLEFGIPKFDKFYVNGVEQKINKLGSVPFDLKYKDLIKIVYEDWDTTFVVDH